LDRAAERMGLTKSALICILVKSFVDELEASGGKMALPFSWQGHKPDKAAFPLPSRSRAQAKNGGKSGKS